MLEWQAISSLSGAVAALAACFATWFAYRTSQFNRESIRAEKESFYFAFVLAQPTMSAIKEASAELNQLLSDFTGNVHNLQPAGSSSLDAYVESFIDEFNQRYYDLLETVEIPANHWGDADLTTNIIQIMHQFQDSITESAAAVKDHSEISAKLKPQLKEGFSRLFRVIREADPVLTANYTSTLLAKRLEKLRDLQNADAN